LGTSAQDGVTGSADPAGEEGAGLSVSVKLPSWAREYVKLLAEMERCGLTIEVPQVLRDILAETEIEIAI
jgi:hypothetical protein